LLITLFDIDSCCSSYNIRDDNTELSNWNYRWERPFTILIDTCRRLSFRSRAFNDAFHIEILISGAYVKWACLVQSSLFSSGMSTFLLYGGV